MHKWGLLIITLFVLSKAAPAENSLSFSQAREIILANNHGLKAGTTETEAAKAGVLQAGALPNPSIGIALDNFGSNEIEASVQQTFEFGGKRYLRTQAAQRELDAAQNTRSLTQIELEAEIVRRFIPAITITSKLEVLDSIIAAAEMTKEQIRRRVDAGASKKTDLIRAEIDLEQYALQRSEFVRKLTHARKKFAALGGDQRSLLENVSGIIDEQAILPSLDILRKAVAASPQISALDIEKTQLEIQQKQLQSENIPNLDLSAGILRNNSDNQYSPLVGFSMNIPLFNTKKAAQDQVRLRQQVLDARKADNLQLLDAEVQDLYSQLVEIDKKIIALRTGTIPKAESVYMILQEYYAAGSIGYLDLTATQAEMLQLRMDLHDFAAERALVLANLMQTTSLHIEIVK